MDLIRIVTEALNAPSGDNCQPWRFSLQDDSISLFNNPQSDQSLYNYDQKASLIGHGALLENILISAAHHGVKADIRLFPDNHEPMYIAEIKCVEGVTDREAALLFPYLKQRVTNRKSYDGRPLSPEIQHRLNAAVNSFAQPYWVTTKADIKEVAGAVSRNEQLVLSNQKLHQFLFSHIQWSAHAMNKNKMGLYLKTLEMNPFERSIFRLASKWNRVRLLNKLGLPEKIAEENKKIYQTSSAFIALTQDNGNPTNYVATGRAVERLWLEATRLGLAVHPLTGIVFLHNRLIDRGDQYFNSVQKSIIETAYMTLRNSFGVPANQRITFLFRLGYAAAPTAISLKKQLADLIQFK